MIRMHVRTIAQLCLAFLFAGCSPNALVDADPPGNFVDPGIAKTETGARQLMNTAISAFTNELGGGGSTYGAELQPYGPSPWIYVVALFTDEAMIAPGSAAIPQGRDGIDARSLIGDRGVPNDQPGKVYGDYHQARIKLRQAREALRRYAPNAHTALQGRLAAMEGNVILWFAELFCSGIPLTTVPMEGDPEETAGYSTHELFQYAVALFDSAIVLSGDSSSVKYFASVGKGRGLLGLGRFDEAAAAVRDVPTDFVIKAYYNGGPGYPFNIIGTMPQSFRIADHEGGNGLAWSTDPRAAIVTTPALSGTMGVPAKYSQTPAGTPDASVSIVSNSIRVADGLEARLIEAEAALFAGDGAWLTILNALRETCVGTAVCAPVPGLTVSQLPALTDPGTPAARLDTLMKERAMWLYLTGHRQGDLRRLARVYGRSRETLWPTGMYTSPPSPPLNFAPPSHTTPYGTSVVFTPDPNEARLNQKYHGCNDLEP